MVVDRTTGKIEHRHFRDLPSFLDPDDLLVFNNTKVINARLYGTKKEGTAKVEILLLRPVTTNGPIWEALVRPGKKLKHGSEVILKDGTFLEIGKRTSEGTRYVTFVNCDDIYELISRIGRVPLPPYIHNDEIDPSDYQTVFAKEMGSAAAPTASLHFTEDILEQIKKKGIDSVWITLHVGIGTFRPVKTDDIREHKIHEEYCEIPQDSARKIANAKGRIIAAGTTVVRTLESMTDENNNTRAGKKMSDLFIYPGYNFKKLMLC